MERTLTPFASDADSQGRLPAFATALAKAEGSSPRAMGNGRQASGPLAGCGSSRLAAGSVGAHTATLGDADVGAQAPAEKVGSSVATMATLDVRSRSLPSSPAGRILLNHAT
jgi:hypothetical protein